MKKLLLPLLLVIMACSPKQNQQYSVKLKNVTMGNSHLFISETSTFDASITLDAGSFANDTATVTGGDYFWKVSVDSNSVVVYVTPGAPVTIDGNKTLIVEYKSTWGDTAYWE
jgi:hypothetical protein